MACVVVSGLGAVSPLGRGQAALWEAIAAGRDAIRPLRRFSTKDYGVAIAALLEEEGEARALCVRWAVEAAQEAMADAGVLPGARLALVLGTSLGDLTCLLDGITADVGDAIGAGGPRLTVTTACASSTNAIGLGMDLLRAGAADAVVAGGADVLTELVFAGFHQIGVLGADKCAPFSQPPGATLGEGAGFFVLESAARARRARAVVAGYGISADGFHETGPDPTGAGVARAMRGALRHAGVAAADVGYVNSHGTGTKANDPAEWRAIQAVLGAAPPPMSATKSLLGHAQGAAGVLEAVVTILAMERDLLPQTLHFVGPRPHGPADPVAQATPRAGVWRHAIKNSSAFGGANCSLVLSRPGEAAPAPRVARRVRIAGMAEATDRGIAIEKLVPTADPQGLDPTAVLLTAAAARALGGAARGAARERTGLVAGVNAPSPASVAAFRASIAGVGLPQLSANAFARLVVNAPAGSCATILSLRGPHSVLDVGEAGGLAAIAYAADLLAHRDDADVIVAGGVDEREGGPEGAACAALAAGDGAGVRVTGWAFTGPGLAEEAVAAALARAGLARADRVVTSPATNAWTSARAVLAAARALAAGEGWSVVVAHAGGRAAACAVVLEVG